MSPSSSTIPRTDGPRKLQPHSRQASVTTSRLPDQDSEVRIRRTLDQQENPSRPTSKPNAHYTVFIRLPFQRADFQDPPPVEWDSTKDEALWKLIFSGSTSKKDVDWEAMSERFDVSLPFLLQQAAWLSERHLERMRKQVLRFGASGPGGAGSPVGEEGLVQRPGSAEGTDVVGSGGVAMERKGSGGVAMERKGSGGEAMERKSSGGVTMERKGSRESQKRSMQLPRKSKPLQTTEDTSRPASSHSARPGVSRTPSTATVTQSRAFAASSRRPSQTYSKSIYSSKRQTPDTATNEDGNTVLGHDDASESESEDDTLSRHPYRRSPLTKKPPMGTLSSDGDADDDEDDDEEGFLPFAARPEDDEDATATLINPPRQQPSTTTRSIANPAESQTNTQDSSASSATSSQPRLTINQRPARATQTTVSSPDTLSPEQRARLSRLSPRYKNAVSGSDGSPSMGSSFSDLDDLSVTHSALEDALLSRVQHGGSIGMGMGSLIERARGRSGQNGNG